jgi:signal peptidase I
MAKRTRGKGKKGGAGRNEPGSKPRSNASEKPEEKRGRKNDRKQESTLMEWTKSLFVALILFLFIRTFLIHTFVIISGSMEETLLVGDLLLVNRAAVGSTIPGTDWRIPGYSKLERGDILVFDPPHEDELKLVKRLMGLPGDTVEMRNKVLIVNGEALEEPYVQYADERDDSHPWMTWQEEYLLETDANGSEYRPTRDNWGPLVIPPDRYFMMGDNRDTSLDSRYWGFLEGWRLEGRAILVYFSYNKGSLRPFPWLREIRWGRILDRVR